MSKILTSRFSDQAIRIASLESIVLDAEQSIETIRKALEMLREHCAAQDSMDFMIQQPQIIDAITDIINFIED